MKRDPITNEQLCALAKRGDADAQNLLIENNLRFIKKDCIRSVERTSGVEPISANFT